jgi:pyruvate dehydrogenase (quinone)
VATQELVMPPFTAPEAAYGMAMYSVRAILHGQGGDVVDMIRENLPKL